ASEAAYRADEARVESRHCRREEPAGGPRSREVDGHAARAFRGPARTRRADRGQEAPVVVPGRYAEAAASPFRAMGASTDARAAGMPECRRHRAEAGRHMESDRAEARCHTEDERESER